MVRCTVCGVESRDDARYCSNCGGNLENVTHPRTSYERTRDECFGLPHGGTIAALVFGLIIVLIGISWLLSEALKISLEIGPLIVMMFGILIVAGALYQFLRRH